MESDESDAKSVEYMRDMYKGCMNESKLLYRVSKKRWHLNSFAG